MPPNQGCYDENTELGAGRPGISPAPGHLQSRQPPFYSPRPGPGLTCSDPRAGDTDTRHESLEKRMQTWGVSPLYLYCFSLPHILSSIALLDS